MAGIWRKIAFIQLLLFKFSLDTASSQTIDHLQYVDPFIGTANGDVFTKWGSEGGVYPGAVAPFGYVQFTPETSVSDKKGYNYPDSSIYFFSCINHHSGYPNGSSGNLIVMPVIDPESFQLRKSHRPFSHKNEKAEPGYYNVLLEDNNTLVEATVAERSGMFRFTFPQGIVPRIFVGEIGEMSMKSERIVYGSKFNTLINFDHDVIEKYEAKEGCILTFAPSSGQDKVIVMKLNVSTVDHESALKNGEAELNKLSFDQLREQTKRKWRKKLSIIDIHDSNEENKTIFYTALYHSLLMPWIISDVEGNYRGRDGQVHKTTGENEYGGFSPWDTFRTLHPLLTLLYPERQKEMVLSMFDIFQQTGHLPVDPMTGNHSVPVIVDSYLKGIRFDSVLAYTAMKKSIDEPPFLKEDLEAYHKHGYLPFTYAESVTKTVEYAYDDWALAQFSKHIMRNNADYERLLERSYSYRNLFYPQELFLLPRKENEFKTEPGTFGYKEGDKWVYSWFVPHQARDLINLMGGDEHFVSRLDSALLDQDLVFDNETVFHVPYLFNYAGKPSMTQKWVKEIMNTRFSATPGGLPGNDDLGSMSSWYVFSAMGFFPTTPGRPVYDFGSPVFQSLTIKLANGMKLAIKSKNASSKNIYVQSLAVNGKPFNQSYISHSLLMEGGEMVFEMGSEPNDEWMRTHVGSLCETSEKPDFEVLDYSISKRKVKPNEELWVKFTLRNSGSIGMKTVRLFVNGQVYSSKNCLVGEGATTTDSLSCRLYQLGKTSLRIEDLKSTRTEVIDPGTDISKQMKVTDLQIKPLVKKGDTPHISYEVQNIGWLPYTFTLPVILGNSQVKTDSIKLSPGERKAISYSLNVDDKEGFQTISVNDSKAGFKVYSSDTDALILDLSLTKVAKSKITDQSGFGNDGTVVGKIQYADGAGNLKLGEDCFVEIPNSPSLDVMGESITMMAWVYPTGEDDGLVDLLTKGDHHVLQVVGNKKLNFFAGGWGRGECTVDLPENWKNNWHHIAGVCDGESLKLYVDGELRGTTPLESKANLSVSNRWNIGRNEEFPSERIFHGHMQEVKIYAEALSAMDIKLIQRKR